MDFSNIDNTSEEIGEEVPEGESKDSDFGDGDGVNDFDDTYNEMNSGNETMEYSSDSDGDGTISDGEKGEFETTDDAVDDELEDFDDSSDTAVNQEVQDSQETADNVEQNSNLNTDESVDDALSDFDDSASEETAESGSEETVETSDARETQSEEMAYADTESAKDTEEVDTVADEETTESDSREAQQDDTETASAENTHDALRNPEQADGVREITSRYYSESKEVAEQSPDNGRFYTDHKEEHVEMVADKSIEAADAIQKSIEKGGMQGENSGERIAFSANIDYSTLEGAALSHDTGMRGSGYALGNKVSEGTYDVRREDNSNFNEVRFNHSLNSAINVLENRDAYKAIGYTDEQVDKMSAECMAHSKSSSGVKDLNSRTDWGDCFDRIDSTVDAYNADHPDSPISFDRTTFEYDDEKLGSLASETLALRVGDVSRDSYEGAVAQAGENVYVDRESINNHGGSMNAELENAKIIIGENGDTVDNFKSRQVHTGEQNIVENHTYANDDGNVVHEVTVDDGAFAPMCTQEALKDHIGELATAKDGNFELDVKFNSACDDFSRDKYEAFRDQIESDDKYANIQINYPWDRR